MQSFFRFTRSLRDRAGCHSSWSHGAGAIVTYAARSIARWYEHDDWLAFLESPAMTGIPARDRTLIERYQHRYISKAWSKARRMRAVRDHYDFALARFPRALFDTLYRERQVLLGKVTLRDGDELSLMLKAPIRRGREGEMSLALMDSKGVQISYAQMSIVDEGKTIVIGCLQGAAADAGLEAVREVTRQCHGLRPKNLLLSMVRATAEALNVQRVLGVSNQSHVFAGIPNKVKADYDGFWLEAKGVPTDDGFYELPPRDPVRSAEQVESKRRGEFRRREALRSEACDRVIAGFGVTRHAEVPWPGEPARSAA